MKSLQEGNEIIQKASINSPDESLVTTSIEREVGIGVEELTSLYILDSIKGFGPQKFKALFDRQIAPGTVLNDPSMAPFSGKTGDEFRLAFNHITDSVRVDCHARAVTQVLSAHKYRVKVLQYSNPLYPRNVFLSNNPVPILFARGNTEILTDQRAVACVGSRKIREPFSTFERAFVKEATKEKFVIVSGFAMGADRIGHETAFHSKGRTICVMPCGLDNSFPPENKDLKEDLLQYAGAVFLSEFGFGVRTSSLTLRKRNKLIVACSLGILIAQSNSKGGAMNAYRFAREQRKPIATFESDLSSDTTGNELVMRERTLYDEVFANPDSLKYKEWLRTLSSSI